MKREKVQRFIRLAVFVFVVAFSLVGTSSLYAQRGSGEMVPGKAIKTVGDIEALQPGDMVAMSCPKCQTITFSRVEEGRGAAKPLRVGEKHVCPGCNTEIETKGVGRQAKDTVVHVCKKCGSEDAFCCSVKKGEMTKGMEKDR